MKDNLPTQTYLEPDDATDVRHHGPDVLIRWLDRHTTRDYILNAKQSALLEQQLHVANRPRQSKDTTGSDS